MKTFIIAVLLLTSGYFGVQLHSTKNHLAATSGELEKAKEEIKRLAPTMEKSWLQRKIDGRNDSLEAGAYNQKSGVARRPTRYYAPVKTPVVPDPTPVRR